MSISDILRGAPIGIKALEETGERKRWTVSHGGALFSFEADTHTILLEHGVSLFSLKGETVAIIPLATASIVTGDALQYR